MTRGESSEETPGFFPFPGADNPQTTTPLGGKRCPDTRNLVSFWSSPLSAASALNHTEAQNLGRPRHPAARHPERSEGSGPRRGGTAEAKNLRRLGKKQIPRALRPLRMTGGGRTDRNQVSTSPAAGRKSGQGRIAVAEPITSPRETWFLLAPAQPTLVLAPALWYNGCGLPSGAARTSTPQGRQRVQC